MPFAFVGSSIFLAETRRLHTEKEPFLKIETARAGLL
jgi:hypothetical protein